MDFDMKGYVETMMKTQYNQKNFNLNIQGKIQSKLKHN